MSNHTKAPWAWQAESKNLAYLVEADDATIIARLSADNVSNNFSRVVANNRRIVACVNACEGISTENLEDNLPVKELADRYNAVLKQRDMLLDVLNKAANDLAYVAYNIDGSKIDGLAAGLSESTYPSETALIVERNCREAIRSVRGGAA